MQTRLRGFVVCLILVGPAKLAVADDTVQQVLARMDKAANDFKAMTAKVTHVDHIEILNDETKEVGSVTMKKVRPGEVEGRVDFTAPDAKIITFEKRKIQEYLPKINTLVGRMLSPADAAKLIRRLERTTPKPRQLPSRAGGSTPS